MLGLAVVPLAQLYGGGHALRTLVVVNRDSDRSLELGRYYAEQRGLPDLNICPIFTTNRINIEIAAYSNDIEGPVHAYVDAAGLSNQIDTVVFSFDIPYRIFVAPQSNNLMASLTATFYYGFFTSPNAFIFGCDLAAGSESVFFEGERSYADLPTLAAQRHYQAAMITASNLDVAKRLVDRSVAADHTVPSSSVYLLRTTDLNRNIQWVEFENVLFLGRFLDVPQTRVWLETNSISGQTNVFGVTAGATAHAWLGQNTALPGAFAEHLTSNGGHLVDSGPQMSILNWIQFGYAGSYGTVVEPCAYLVKFTSPRIHYWYARGFSLGESLWMSVKNPYQGIFVGDPLCAPYAVPPSVAWLGLTNGSAISGTLNVTGHVMAASSTRPVSSIMWARNGKHMGVLTNIPPQPGNVITVTINGTSRNYTVKSGDTLYSAATGLVAVLNSPPQGIFARAFGDRIELKQSTPGISALGWTCHASVSPGTASVATVQVALPATNFMETTSAAREGLLISGTSKSGDVVRTIITRLDGATFTNQIVVNVNGMPLFSIMAGLANAINANPNLQTAIGVEARYPRDGELWLFSRTNTWEGANLFVDFQVLPVTNDSLDASYSFADIFNDNADSTTARATIFLSSGVTQIMPSLLIDTTNWPDGPHELLLIAREGTGVGTEKEARVRVQVKNHDLECIIDSPPDRIYRLKSGVLTVDVSTASSANVTQLVLFVEGKQAAVAGMSAMSTNIALAAYGVGPLHVQAQAWDDAGNTSLSAFTVVQLYTDADGDGVSDQWEYRHFGSATNFNGQADPDGDGYSNYREFIADTEPTNSASFLSIHEITFDPGIRFPTSTNRLYRVQLNDTATAGLHNWYPAGPLFGGDGSVMTWLDVPTNAPAATNDFRLYAIEPQLMR